jgi:hypothetical protein
MNDKMNSLNTEVQKTSSRIDIYKYERFAEHTNQELVLLARQLHARSYKGEDFIHDEAVDEDGTMADDMDKARGDSVNYYIGYDPTQEGSTPVSTLRKISLRGDQTIEYLPGYQLSKAELYDEEREWLASVAPRRIKEISSFGHTPESPATAGLELLRTVLQDSVGSNEIWFFTMVSEKYDTLVKLFGPTAVRKIGEAVPMDDHRVADISLVPAIVDTSLFFQQVYESAVEETIPAKRRRQITNLTYFTEGLTESQMGSDVFNLTRGVSEVKAVQNEELDIATFIRQQPGYNPTNAWRAPDSYDLTIKSDETALSELLKSGQVYSIHDTFDANELFELHYPLEYDNESSRRAFIDDIETRREKIGTWFHYPWSESLVHFPSQSDYQSLRTLRNRNMITNEEQARLLSATPLVAGMSVGSNVVEQLVYSGIGGSFILADFDTLSMSNLNRIHTGMQQVGDSKIDIIAKKISELDPYVSQVHMREGVTRESLEALTEIPDIIFDEVDDFSAKAILRQFAQKNKIPLIMATDVGETSIIDIERHDIEEVKLFNGRLKQETIDMLLSDDLSDEDKKKITTKLIGLGNASIRLIASVNDATVLGTPQLGTTASIGGGLASIVAREILLGSDVKTGRKVFKARGSLDLPSQSTFQESIKTIRQFLSKS